MPEMQPKPNVKLPNVCPPDIGGKDWQPSAFSPRTGLVYAGIFNICMDVTDHPQSYIPGTPYDGMEMTRHAAPGGNWGEFMAWDPVTGKKVWSIKEQFMTMSGALATAGDVVFYGTVDGWFRAVDARSGKVLWSQKLELGNHRPADDLSRARQAPVRGGLFGRRRRRDGERVASRASRHAAACSTSSRSTATRRIRRPGMLTTEGSVPAARSDHGMGGKP